MEWGGVPGIFGNCLNTILKITGIQDELIARRADASKPNMGLTTWKNSPKGKILKTDVSISKNYLSENELNELNRIVTMYLDYAENQAGRQIPMKMIDWTSKLEAFLQFNEYDLLKDAGKVSHKIAQNLANKPYEQYRVTQDRTSNVTGKVVTVVEKEGANA